jgi:hypothetical protein
MREYASKKGVDKERDKHDDFRICTLSTPRAYCDLQYSCHHK